MRIEKIVIKNYRRFKNLEITFDKNKKNDLHFIIGKNGSGKTNFLNAINWCLYNKEPHKSKKDLKLNDNREKLPRLNVYNTSDTVLVEVWLETEENNYIIFHREEIYNIKNNRKLSKPINTDFHVDIPDEKSNRNIKTGEDANLIVEQHFPEAIREYFFFDGERLDTYFQQATSTEINHEIFIISYINALENMHYHSGLLIKDLDKEASRFSSNIEEIIEKKELNEKQFIENKKRMEETNSQLTKAKNKISKYRELLKNQPNYTELDNELSKWNKMKIQKDESLKQFRLNHKKLLFKFTIILGLWPAFKNSLDIIKEKRRNLELPPVNEQILENALKHEDCDICGKKLDINLRNRIEKVLERFKSSSKNVKKLEPMENDLNKYNIKIWDFKRELNEINNLLKAAEDEYRYIDTQISSINDKLGGHDEEKIRTWHSARVKFEKIRDSNLITLDSFKNK